MAEPSPDHDILEPAALATLKTPRFRYRAGVFFAQIPNAEITQAEWDAIHYLCDEWDHAFESLKPGENE